MKNSISQILPFRTNAQNNAALNKTQPLRQVSSNKNDELKKDSFIKNNKKKITIAAAILASASAVAIMVASFYKGKNGGGESEKVAQNVLEDSNSFLGKGEQGRSTKNKTRREINIINRREGAIAPIYQAFTKERDYDKAKKIFKENTGLNLHCPAGESESNPLGAALIELQRISQAGNFPADIKHVVIGHGIGSSLDNSWRFIGNGKKVFDYIDENIPKGEKALLVVCEETSNKVAGKAAIGSEVATTFSTVDKPAKIVCSGHREIIGQFLDPYFKYPNNVTSGAVYY